MRRAAILFFVLALCGCRADNGGGPEELLPDLVQAPPQALAAVRADDGWRLAFLSAVENEGLGPLVVEGRRPSRAVGTMSVRQLVRRSDGSAATYDVGALLRFAESESHRHWHYLGFERYEILSVRGRVLGRDRKTGFCLGDRYDAQAGLRIRSEPATPLWTQECGRGQPERLRLREGLSPGYGDDYVPVLEGQSVGIDDLPAGSYRLRHRVNVDRALRESDYGNNSASVLFDLTWSQSGTPSVEPVYQG
ncbi:MAG: lysyl oxidase family protein [Gaiellaceae bacterium]